LSLYRFLFFFIKGAMDSPEITGKIAVERFGKKEGKRAELAGHYFGNL